MTKTNLLILICILFSFFLWSTNTESWAFLFFSTDNLLSGRFWTVFTTLFIHADILHLFGNMLFLYVFGNTLENIVNGRNMLLIFFTGGIVTCLLGIPFYNSETYLVGASAAIFTLAAAVMLIKPLKFSWLFLMMPTGLVAILYFFYNIIAVYQGSSGGVAYISHIIGFLIGIPFGIYWSKNWTRNICVAFLMLIIYLIVITLFAPLILDSIKNTLTNI
ncbi:MAG: rhomboid family intramembrane serine protease [Candidatus Bathyarchaeia archaeon]|nr:rhomboid family intramembrane serine protease [Candidatus Bathyarchaeota archaeon]